jgi:DNA-binding transcriptional MerR regulator
VGRPHNGRRYSALEDLELIEEILRAEGMDLSDVDERHP